MEEETHTEPTKALFAGRLRDLDELSLRAQGCAEAFDEKTGKHVLVGLEKKSRNPTLATLSSIEHAHLVEVVGLVDHDDDWVVVSNLVHGTTLRARLQEIGRKHAVDAVRTALRVADVLSHLHDAGITHGRVNPDNVLLALEVGQEPALIFGQQSSPEYLRPERNSQDEAYDPRDDTWATTALLYFMLSGDPPPPLGIASLSALEGLRIDDSLLCEVLLHGLARDEAQRAKNLSSLKRELARWFIGHAADEPAPIAGFSHKPPPLPPSVAPKPPVRSAAPEAKSSSAFPRNQALALEDRRRGWLRSVPFAVVAAVVGIGVAWGVARMTRSDTKAVRLPEQPGATTAQTNEAGPIDLAEVPVTGDDSAKEQAGGDSTASCAKAYLRAGMLTKFAQLDAICRDTELPRALGMLRLSFTSLTGATGVVPPGASRFDGLGWYSLPLLFGLRKACCTDPPSIKLPDLGKACDDFPAALDELARVASTTQQFDSVIGRYTIAARCAAQTGKAAGISPVPPSIATEKAFRDLFLAASAP
ncbi:MAG TPA: protein kinase [Polyangiaceae bacterium]|nr:protein kinase [Polyangiaceae bacterium]